MRSARTKYQKVNQDISFPGQQEQSPGQLSDSAAYQSQHQTNKIPISPFFRQYLIFQISMKSYLPKYQSTLIKISQLLINMLKKKNFTFTSCTLTFLIIAEFSKFSTKDSIFFFIQCYVLCLPFSPLFPIALIFLTALCSISFFISTQQQKYLYLSLFLFSSFHFHMYYSYQYMSILQSIFQSGLQVISQSYRSEEEMNRYSRQYEENKEFFLPGKFNCVYIIQILI